jgi:hypothetical protein
VMATDAASAWRAGSSFTTDEIQTAPRHLANADYAGWLVLHARESFTPQTTACAYDIYSCTPQPGESYTLPPTQDFYDLQNAANPWPNTPRTSAVGVILNLGGLMHIFLVEPDAGAIVADFRITPRQVTPAILRAVNSMISCNGCGPTSPGGKVIIAISVPTIPPGTPPVPDGPGGAGFYIAKHVVEVARSAVVRQNCRY